MARQAAIAGNPTSEELQETLSDRSRSGVVASHKMRKRRVDGRDFWTCERCQYGTFREASAKEHETQPV